MKTTPETTVRITYYDGTPDTISTYGGAFRVISTRYDIPEENLVIWRDNCRMLVWPDEESYQNDDGANAIAEITEA